jgi:hypothetical protein
MVDAAHLVWCLGTDHDAPVEAMVAGAASFRELGSRAGFAAGLSDGRLLDAIEAFQPELVRFDAAPWYPPGLEARLTAIFATLVAVLRREGVAVLVSGIATAAQLEAALDSGADLVCGPLLAPPALAGTLFDDQPRPISGFLLGECSSVQSGHQAG